MPIKRLSVQLANQIAAGEVVERPSSVVKELVENAVDAGATIITLEIRGSGKQLIKVTDNGKGIPEDELALALAPHATSKIACLEDLAAIVTMGFRGEALASIASVSRLTLTSRTAEQPHACQVEVSGPEQNPIVAPAAHPAGTTVTVSDLFFNTPARRHFLKSDKTEFNHIKDLMIRLALVNYGIEFKFISDGKTILHVPAQSRAKLGDRIAALLGREFKADVLRFDNGDLQYVNAYRRYLNLPQAAGPAAAAAAAGSGAPGSNWDDGLEPDDHDPLSRQVLSIYGVLVKPQSFTRTAQDRLLTFLNGRCIADRTVNHAIREAYLNAVQQDLDFKPCIRGVIFMECDPRTVDVNVHPRKDEVRFHNASIIHDCILANVKSVFELNNINKDNARMGRLGVDDMACVDQGQPQTSLTPEETIRRRREILGSQRSIEYAQQVQNYLNSTLRPLRPLQGDAAAAAASAASDPADPESVSVPLPGRLCSFEDLLTRALNGEDLEQARAAITAIRRGTSAASAAAASSGPAGQSGAGPASQSAAGLATTAGGIWNGSLIDDDDDILPQDAASADQLGLSAAGAAAAGNDDDELMDDEGGHDSSFAQAGSRKGALPGTRSSRNESAFTLDFLLQTQERERITRMLNAAAGRGRNPDQSVKEQPAAPTAGLSTAASAPDSDELDFLSRADEALSWADSEKDAAYASAPGASDTDTENSEGGAFDNRAALTGGAACADTDTDTEADRNPVRGMAFDSAVNLRSRSFTSELAQDADAQDSQDYAHAGLAGAESGQADAAYQQAGAESGQADAAYQQAGAEFGQADAAYQQDGSDAESCQAGASSGRDDAAAPAVGAGGHGNESRADGALHRSMMTDAGAGAAMGASSAAAAAAAAAGSMQGRQTWESHGSAADSPWGRGRSAARQTESDHRVPGMQRMSADEVSALMSMQGKCQFQSLVTADVALMNIGSRYFMVRCSELYYSRMAFEYARDVSQDQVSAQELPMPFAIRCDSTLVQAFRPLDALAAAARCGFSIKVASIRSSIEINAIPKLAAGCNLAAVALEALQIIARSSSLINTQAHCPEALSALMARCRTVAINTAYDARNLIEGIDSMLSLRKAAQNGALMEISLMDMARVLLGSQG